MKNVRDINVGLTKNLVNDTVSSVSNKHAVSQIILDLLQTNTMEIPFKEWEGSGLSALLGEACSNMVAAAIIEQIRLLIQKYIKYIEVNDITYRIDFDNQRYIFLLKYNFVSDVTIVEQELILTTTI